MLFELGQERLEEALAVLLVIQRRQFPVATRHVLHQQRVAMPPKVTVGITISRHGRARPTT